MSNGMMREIDDSSLVQLINRVGRSNDISAKIFCHPDDFQRIHRLLNNPSISAVQPIPFGDGKTSFEKYTIKDKISTILSLF